jgi:hypothetical protein
VHLLSGCLSVCLLSVWGPVDCLPTQLSALSAWMFCFSLDPLCSGPPFADAAFVLSLPLLIRPRPLQCRRMKEIDKTWPCPTSSSLQSALLPCPQSPHSSPQLSPRLSTYISPTLSFSLFPLSSRPPPQLSPHPSPYHLLNYFLNHLLAHLLTYLFNYFLIYLLNHLLAHSVVHLLTYLLIYLLAHLTYLLNRPRAHLLAHFLPIFLSASLEKHNITRKLSRSIELTA